MKIAAIFGGSGFIGTSLVTDLLAKGFRVKVITRDKEKSAFLKTFAGPDFISLEQWNYQDSNALKDILNGCDVAVNLIGILSEGQKGDFTKYHTDLPGNIAKECKKQKIQHFVHISALAIQNSPNSKYAASKLAGEKLVKKNFSNATILRPSIIFGESDNFFNKFSKMVRFSSLVPLIGSGNTKFQPIYVEDLVKIISHILCSKKTPRRVYEVGGNSIYSFKRLIELVVSYRGKEVRFANLSFSQAKLLASVLEIFTKNILTRDQVELLKTDNVLSESNFKKDFPENITNLKSVEEIVPNYIS